MVFTAPQALWLLSILPLFAGLFVWRWRVRQRKIARLGDTALVASLLGDINPRMRWIKTGLWVVALVCGIVALARPTWGIAEELVEAEGIAVIVVLDVSTSMDAQDTQPSRLERAKLDARAIFEGSSGNQLGLVLFAGSAFTQLPLTTDWEAALTFLSAASSRSISRQGTALADAVELAVDSFDPRISTSGVIIVLSDGENHEGDPLESTLRAAELGIAIHTIGYGDPQGGAPIPELEPDGTFTNAYKSDAAGNLILTRLEEGVLRNIATAAGGTYQQATSGGIEVVNLLNEVASLERSVIDRQRQTRRIERYGWFVSIALIALGISSLIDERRRENARSAAV